MIGPDLDEIKRIVDAWSKEVVQDMAAHPRQVPVGQLSDEQLDIEIAHLFSRMLAYER